MPAASLQQQSNHAEPSAVPDAAARIVIGYVRVSSEEQGASGLGLEAQRAAITTECERRGWRLARIEEDVSSGTRLDRPGLNAAVEAVSSGEVEGLVVSKLDRLSRSVAHFSSLLERFRSRGWGLVILDLGIDTTSVMGEAMATMAATFAQVERRRIGERTREALAVRRSQGVKLGRPRSVPLAVELRIRRSRRRGLSFQAIADRLNREGVPTAHGGARWYAATVRHVALRCERDSFVAGASTPETTRKLVVAGAA